MEQLIQRLHPSEHRRPENSCNLRASLSGSFSERLVGGDRQHEPNSKCKGSLTANSFDEKGASEMHLLRGEQKDVLS